MNKIKGSYYYAKNNLSSFLSLFSVTIFFQCRLFPLYLRSATSLRAHSRAWSSLLNKRYCTSSRDARSVGQKHHCAGLAGDAQSATVAGRSRYLSTRFLQTAGWSRMRSCVSDTYGLWIAAESRTWRWRVTQRQQWPISSRYLGRWRALSCAKQGRR